jgi:AcrR family transcriptional regulator
LTAWRRRVIILTMLGTPNDVRVARRRAATRAEILEAAWDVVHTDGVAGLTLKQVADRVGMRPPSLYSHFSSKLDIVDAMFGAAWGALDAVSEQLEKTLPDEPREALAVVATSYFDFATQDPERHALMSQRSVPGFRPTAAAYAPSVRVAERLGRVLDRIGIHDPAAADLWTAILSGLVSQQLANDPGGDRWRRLLRRTVDMYADELGLPRPHRRT